MNESQTMVQRAVLEPGQRVLHPARPDWGVGQVQSAIGNRVTVNFENAGKVVLNLAATRLDLIDDEG